MATILLGAAGAAIGGGFGGAILGLSGAVIGRAVGALIGNVIDQSLASSLIHSKQEGPRLEQASITASTEGTPIARLQGRARMTGQVIWATRFDEDITTESQRSGGKGPGPKVTTTTYNYYANFAVAFCEGPISHIGRIWADGREIDQTEVTIRIYRGTETQMPDALIIAKEGVEVTSAFRGTAYILFDRLHINTYGNRIPQITAEIYRSVGELETKLPGVCIIPGATEFGYHPKEVTAQVDGETISLNRHTLVEKSDWSASMDQLEALAPNCNTVMLVVAWFGDDLRAGNCTIRPKVMAGPMPSGGLGIPFGLGFPPFLGNLFQGSTAITWAAAGLTRATAGVVSNDATGTAAFGGSPSDASVIEAIKDLKARGFDVVLCPFVLMDINATNTLPNPYSAGAAGVGQSAYPWRGQITCSPAPGKTGSPDKTAAAATQVDTFFTRTNGYNAFVTHIAGLAQTAGGVKAFLIGSELAGLTTVRSGAGTYPAVARLKTLAASVRVIVGAGTKISYAADWSEYHSHRPADGTGDVYFHLDPLWSDANIDFIGIDNYLPIADWRDGTDHLDYSPTDAVTIYEPGYLDGGIEGGEYYDWYYPDAAARDAQLRAPITDGAYSKPWVFRQKDIRGWWNNLHYNRPAGVESGAPTAWTPGLKPIWFTELGCPAVDKGANEPNRFIDAKSAASGLPYYSTGARDDAMQRAFLEAHLDHWASDPMVARTLVWCWDARPSPSFPQNAGLWGDGVNWHRGHWLSGRLGSAPAKETIIDVFARAGFTEYSVSTLGSVVDAVIAGQLASPRTMIEALASVHNLQAIESGAEVRVESRANAPLRGVIDLGDLVRTEEENGDALKHKRAQETDLPAELTVTWQDPTADDRPASAPVTRDGTSSRKTASAQLPVVMSDDKGRTFAEILMRDLWWGRETAETILPPSAMAYELGDVLRLGLEAHAFRVLEIGEGSTRPTSMIRTDPSAQTMIATPPSAIFRVRNGARLARSGRPSYAFLDIPLLRDTDEPYSAYLAARNTPWNIGIAFWRSASGSGYQLDTVLATPAGIGLLAGPLPAGPVWRWDRANALVVKVYGRQLISAEDALVFAGVNSLAIEQASGEWEIVQFADAELIDTNTYRLTKLLRGQRGTEHAMGAPATTGSRVIVLDGAVRQASASAAETGLPLSWRIGPATMDVGNPSMISETVTLKGRGARPFAPVQLRGRKTTGGDWILTWIRRTRVSGDSWALLEVPLSEATESYTVEILNAAGSVILRTVASATTTITWTLAMQTADTGGAVTSFQARIFQNSTTFGRGIPALAAIGV